MDDIDAGKLAAVGHGLTGTLAERITEWPLGDGGSSTVSEIAALQSLVVEEPGLGRLGPLLAEAKVLNLVTGVVSGSPYLKGLIQRDPARLLHLLDRSPEQHFAEITRDLEAAVAASATLPEAMRHLRQFKTQAALLIALCDLAGVWAAMEVTRRLTETADAALRAAIRFLFRLAAEKGDWLPVDRAAPEQASGYIVLAMGKHGAFELNYSSDIDLIVFYELELLRLRDGLEPSTFMVRLTRDLVKLMDERTVDGYVFRTDLRLRPDAGATQVALSTESALNYYEAVGQNWERAALIKARPCAGDIQAGEAFLAELAPFVWRKYLDFAAIADVHAMKRQINAYRGLGGIGVAGHNLKLGSGGIREIEFFVQTQQLIAGGRQTDLRVRPTLTALARLLKRGWIKPGVAADLEAAYVYLRRIEHRVQMVADEQTHELPQDEGALANVARFCGYPDIAAFAAVLIPHLETVQKHYAALFENCPELTAGGVNMVFAGESDDPDTLAALKRMGYSHPSQIIATVRGWHHGRIPVMRSARARERLTEVQPLLVAALAETADPDRAMAGFDRFLTALPSGVQLFSLLRANPGLLRLVADIMGTAPRLARVLSRRSRLLDAVLDPRTFATLPTAADIDALLSAEIDPAGDLQEKLDRARVVGSEQAFLIGIRVLSGTINASQAGQAYALLAERTIAALQTAVETELERAHGRVPGGSAAVVAMGKLGGHEMTAASDLDLIVIYDFDPNAVMSGGERPLAPSQFYARFTQRLITALSAPTAEGSLYEVDMRLRPSGQQGPVATQLTSFIDYQANEAWTWEQLALTRARVITGEARLRAEVEAAIGHALVRPRARAKIAADVLDMRRRIETEKGTSNIWELKQVRGGLVDQEFIAQYLQLIHADTHPEILDQNTVAAYQKLVTAGLLAREHAEILLPAARLVHDLTQILRLCVDGAFDPATAPPGLKELLARAGDAPSFAVLERNLKASLDAVASLFAELVN